MSKTLPCILCVLQLPPPVHGASIANSNLINSELLNNEFSIKTINLQFSKTIDKLTLFSFAKVLKVFLFAYKIVKGLISDKPDLIYFTLSPNGLAFYRDVFYVFIFKISRVKIIYHLHGKGIRESANSNFFASHLYKWLFKNTRVICLAKCLTSDLADVNKTIPFIVPNGIQLKGDIELATKKFDKPMIRLLFLSNYVREKGILDLIDALSILKDSGHLFNARLVGAPMDLTIEFLNKYVDSKKLSEFVNIMGPIYGDDKIKELKDADFFIFPTYYKNEAFPLSILEAMQFGLPVISTFEGGIPEIIDDEITGFLTPKRDPKSLAVKIEILINDPELRIKMGQAGRLKFLGNYTLEIFEQNMKNVFETVINRK